VRLATFNILHGRSPADGKVDVDRFAAAIRSLDADVLALQEVDRDHPRSLGADLTAVAAEAMGATEHRFVAALAGLPGATWQAATGAEQPGTASYGVALLARYPTRWGEVVRLPALSVPVPFLFRGQRRPQLVRDEPRVAVAAVVESPLGELAVATTHLSFLPGWNVLQLRRLLGALTAYGQPLVLMGDLNMSLGRVARVSGLRPLAVGSTYPADRPTQQIDHILGRGLPPAGAAGVRQLTMSDHRALWVDI
jgi:endonuclease/exonuclease/phosphatase family metal-dependent hydrolase